MINHILEIAIRDAAKDRHYALIPSSTIKSLWNYVYHHIEPGSFVCAVLSNDLVESVSRADDWNMRALQQTVSYVYNELPRAAWHSAEAVNAWLKKTRPAPVACGSEVQHDGSL